MFSGGTKWEHLLEMGYTLFYKNNFIRTKALVLAKDVRTS